jgi:hypothetical protein
MAIRVPDPPAADALDVVDAAAAADVADDDPPAAGALDDVDEVDPHPPSTAAVMATTTAPAPTRARLDLNMSATPLSTACPRAGPR